MNPTLWTSMYGFPGVRAHLTLNRLKPAGRQTVYVATPDRLHGYRDMPLHVVGGYPAAHAARFVLEVQLGRFTIIRHGGENCQACQQLREAVAP